MKKSLLVLLACLALFSFSACDKEKCDCVTPPADSELTLTFRATYDGERLVKNQQYNYDDFKVKFSRFNTYISDIQLLQAGGGDPVLVSDIEWVDFTPDFATDNNTVDVTIKFPVPSGTYTGIRMGYGVKSDLNAKKPADFAAGHPLANENEYWSGWKSYIFNKLEGEGDGDNNGTADLFLSYHCGSDPVYRTADFANALDLTQGAAARVVEIDVKKLFYQNDQWFDMRGDGNQATSNALSDLRVARFLMDNFDNATSIK
jgi:hypothetical protein